MYSKINPNDYYDLPLLKLFLLKRKLALRCYLADLWNSLYYKNSFERTIKLKNTKEGSALIIANGPRLNDCINNAKENHMDALNSEVFCLNDYIIYSNFFKIKPNYYTLVDHIYFEENFIEEFVTDKFCQGVQSSKEMMIERFNTAQIVKSKIINSNDIKLFMPVKYYSKFQKYPNIYPVSGKMTSAVSNIKDITKTLGWRTLTAYYSISIAIYMGFSKIYIAGFDSDSFKTIRYDTKDKCIKYNYPHFFKQEDQNIEKIIQGSTPQNMLSEVASVLRLHKNINFINLDPSGIFG